MELTQQMMDHVHALIVDQERNQMRIIQDVFHARQEHTQLVERCVRHVHKVNTHQVTEQLRAQNVHVGIKRTQHQLDVLYVQQETIQQQEELVNHVLQWHIQALMVRVHVLYVHQVVK